jgi:hypothetical protein
MRKILIILLTINSLSFFGQIYSDCFHKLKLETDVFLSNLGGQVAVGDTVDNIIEAMESRQKRLIGCGYPYSPVSTFDKKEINVIKFSTDYVIVNFNYLYCDNCISELEFFIKLKTETKKTITVIVFFKEKTEELIELINKYKNEIYFVTDAGEYIENHSLGAGKPLNYILDNNKNILYAKSGTGQTYEGLKEVIK